MKHPSDGYHWRRLSYGLTRTERALRCFAYGLIGGPTLSLIVFFLNLAAY